MTLGELLDKEEVTPEEIEKHIESISHGERIAQTTTLNRKQEEHLWELAGKANKPFEMDFLVPADADPLDPVSFEGKNSLPVFTRFRKVFYRTPEGEVAGYNNQTMQNITGPGYFVVENTPGKQGPVMVNYTRIPKDKPAGWPQIRPNEKGLQRFIYAGMNDYLRWVSPHVVIGRAYDAKTQKPKPNWFVLCRRNP